MSRRSTRSWALRRTVEVLAARAAERLGFGARGGELPSSPGAVSAKWLTSVMCSGVPGARVVTVARLAKSVGTTTRQALVVTYNEKGAGADLPARLFIKSTTTAAQRLMLGLGGIIDGEPGFYDQVRPLLEIEAPVGYFGAVDRRTWRSIVVIEDVVATRGARFWGPAMNIDRGQLEDLLTSVATWHGATWNSDRLARWGWLKTPAEQMRVIDALIGMADRRPSGASRAADVIPAALRERQADLYEGLRRSMALMSDEPHTYLHGDLHVANTYLTESGSMGVADWQVGLRGAWAFDCAYLISTAAAVDDRRAWEHDLLDLYLERLAAAGGPTISAADAWESYRRATFYPYFAWIYTIGRSRLQPQFQPDEVSLTMIERIAAAIEDLDSLRAVGL